MNQHLITTQQVSIKVCFERIRIFKFKGYKDYVTNQQGITGILSKFFIFSQNNVLKK